MAGEDVDVETVDTTGFKDMIHGFLLFQNEKSRRNKNPVGGIVSPAGLRCCVAQQVREDADTVSGWTPRPAWRP